MSKNTTVKPHHFITDDEPKAKQPVTLRLPRSLDEKLRAKMDQPQLVEWCRQAAIEKYQREEEGSDV